MILFPLMTGWIWLHIVTASSFLSFARPVQATLDSDISMRPVRFEGD
jgi:hypothetical protein